MRSDPPGKKRQRSIFQHSRSKCTFAGGLKKRFLAAVVDYYNVEKGEQGRDEASGRGWRGLPCSRQLKLHLVSTCPSTQVTTVQ